MEETYKKNGDVLGNVSENLCEVCPDTSETTEQGLEALTIEEPSALEIQKIYFQNLKRYRGKKRRRCISQELSNITYRRSQIE